MTRDDIFAPKWWLRAADLKQDGETLTIESVELTAFGRDRDPKATVQFTGFKKRLILNGTQFDKIVELTGEEDTDDWGGVRIRLCPTTITIQNGDETKTVDTIAIEPAAPPSKSMAKQKRPLPVPAQTEEEMEVPF